MKISLILLRSLVLAGSFLHAEEPNTPPSLQGMLIDERFLAALRSEAISRHPSVRSSKQLAAAATRDERAIRLWDDPAVDLSLKAASPAMRRDDGDVRLSFEQPLPKRGLFQANLLKMDALRRASEENSVISSLEIGAAVAKDAIELALSDETIALQRKQVEWLDLMIQNARQRSLNPDATIVDALRLQSELVRERQILEAAYRSRVSLAQRLNLQLGRSLESAWPPLRLPTDPLPVPLPQAELSRISAANPKVRALREIANVSSAETRIAQAERQPQFAIGVDADLYSGGDVRAAEVGLKMSLPFFNRNSYQQKIQAATLREKATLQDVEAARLEIAAAVLATTADAANAAAQARAYSGEIRSQSLQVSQALEGAWISSKSPLTDLLESRRAHFSILMEQRRFIAMQQVALEELNILLPHHP